MTDLPEIPKKTPRDKAELLLQMTREAQRVERRTGATACIVICMFEENGQLLIQDAGRFPAHMLPDHFYHVMQTAHQKGQMSPTSPKVSKIIKPH